MQDRANLPPLKTENARDTLAFPHALEAYAYTNTYLPGILNMEASGTEKQRQERILCDDRYSEGTLSFPRAVTAAEPVVA